MTSRIQSNSASIEVDDNVLVKLIPDWTTGTLKIDGDFNIAQLLLFGNVLKHNAGENILYGVFGIISSFKDAYFSVLLCKNFGIASNIIYEIFGAWVDYTHWTNLSDPEWMYPLYSLENDLVHWGKYANKCPRTVMQTLIKSLKLPEIRGNKFTHLQAIKFVEEFDLTRLGLLINDTIQGAQSTIEKQRRTNGKDLLIDISEYYDMFSKTTTTDKNIWPCNVISAIKPITNGNTICTNDEFQSRICAFSYGMLDRPVADILSGKSTPGVTFPANVYCVGGSISRLIASNFDPKMVLKSDLDLFICGKTILEQNIALELLVKWFQSPSTYFAVKGCVMSIYIAGINRKFQVISANSSDLYQVLSNFDLTNVMFAYDPVIKKTYCTHRGYLAMTEQVARPANIVRLNPDRIIKSMYYGYDMAFTDKLLEKCDMAPMLTPQCEPQRSRVVRGFHAYFYPAAVTSYEVEDHNIAMIERDSNASFILKDVKEVVKNFVIGGDFDSNYEAATFAVFNVANITNIGQFNHTPTLKGKGKADIRLFSNVQTITAIATTDVSVDITVEISDDFVQFINTLEDNVFKAFFHRNNGINEKLVIGKILTYKIKTEKILELQKHGISMVKTRRGSPLNINEELYVGDQIQTLFNVKLHNYVNQNRVELSVIQIVKYVDEPLLTGENDEIEENVEIDEKDVVANNDLTDSVDINYD